MLPLLTTLQSWLVHRSASVSAGRRDAGQATAEYALVLVGAAAVALLLIAWATRTDRIGRLLDTVIDSVAGHVR